MKIQETQTAFSLIQQLASLAATPNISTDNVDISNQMILTLLTKIVKPAVAELTAEASGLIIK